MKTEPTEEMREKIERLFEFTDEDIHQIEKLQLAKKYFVEGYNEAMRWRDPKEELPEKGVDVFVKVIRSGEYGDETIYTSSRVVNDFYHSNETDPFGCEGYYPAGNGGRVRATVIGWRPIE